LRRSAFFIFTNHYISLTIKTIPMQTGATQRRISGLIYPARYALILSCSVFTANKCVEMLDSGATPWCKMII